MFEKSIKELEEIVAKLEAGDTSLSESLELFEKGIKLAKECNKMLDEAEKKVSVLIGGEKKDFDEE
ncbi:MAG: exodeoxyribonuclease VII small subunit [Clostridia bacterium]|nr:exodeoxyribonuclease VII small subunit [Clostridia bacterium]